MSTRILVWDLPTRLFHWLLAGGFIAAFTIANVAGHGSSVFPVHMILGLTLAFMVVLRLVWGLVGTRWARFGSFLYGPGAVLEYVRGTFRGTGTRYVGHNPGSSVAIFAILALALGMAATGLLMSSGNEAFEEIHEVLAWVFFGTVVAHVVGVVWHVVRHKENIVRSMVDGHKEAEPATAISSARPVVALVFLALTGYWAGSLFASYDEAASTVTVPLLGQTLQLGEGEDEHGGDGRGGGNDDDSHDDEGDQGSHDDD